MGTLEVQQRQGYRSWRRCKRRRYLNNNFDMTSLYTKFPDPGENYHFPTDRSSWSLPPETSGNDVYLKISYDVTERWKFLGPFFASHGYYLYHAIAHRYTIPPQQVPPSSTPRHSYPYPRCVDGLGDADFDFIYTQVTYVLQVHTIQALTLASGVSYLGCSGPVGARGGR